MLPAGAFAVVLMLNGAQIMLPAPAFVEQGRVWAPAREVLQRLGFTVRWQAPERALMALSEGQQLRFPELPPPWPVPATPTEALYSRRVGNVLYLPLLALRHLGLKTAWDSSARRVAIFDATAMPVSLGAILNSPPEWLDRTVVLVGAYLGWDAYPFCYATRLGPPVASGDWVLGTDDGAIYCTPDPAWSAPVRTGLSPARTAPLLLTPYSALGRRLTVTGRVALAPSGVPYLRHQNTALLTGPEGLSCHLTPCRQQVLAGQELPLGVTVYNPGPGGIAVAPGTRLTLTIAVAGGGMYVVEQSWPLLTQDAIAADGERSVLLHWRVPSNAAPGTYAVSARLGDLLHSIVQHFEVLPPEAG